MTVGTVAEGLPPGSRIRHAELGEGGVLEAARDGWMRAFFPFGERRVALTAVQSERLRAERMRSAVEGSCSSKWELRAMQENWPKIRFHALREHAGLVFQQQLEGQGRRPGRPLIDDCAPLVIRSYFNSPRVPS